jgi:hypothetical protein
MRICCPHCGTNGIVTQTRTECAGLKTVYLQCPNPACGARTVHQVSYSHDLVAPQADLPRLAGEILERLSHEQRAELVRRFAPVAAAGRVPVGTIE